jgi:hypothetical protein
MKRLIELFAVVIVLVAGPALAGGGAPVQGAAAEDPAPLPAGEEKPAAGVPAPESAPTPAPEAAAVVVQKGTMVNGTYGFRMPVPKGWMLAAGATADRTDFNAPECEECMLRIMVSPGNSLPLKETAETIRAQIAASPGARLIGEEPIEIAGLDGYTLVKEEPLAAAPAPAEGKQTEGQDAPAPAVQTDAPTIKTRYVTFEKGSDKFYLVLRAPRTRFWKDDASFEKSLSKLRFEIPAAPRTK